MSSTLGSRAMAAGLTVTLLSVSVAMHLGAGGFGLLLCFVGVLIGTSLVLSGIRMADGDGRAPLAPMVFDGARGLAAFVRRNISAVGLVMASFAVTTMVSGETDPVLCFAMFMLLLLGVSLINIGGARRE